MAQKFEGDVNNLKTGAVACTPEEVGKEPDYIAIGLLKLQQRFEALDKLYNEEIGKLSRDLAQMKADYVRLYQATSAGTRAGKSSRRQTARTRNNS